MCQYAEHCNKDCRHRRSTLHVSVCKCMRVRVRARACVHTHTHTHTESHMHTQPYIGMLKSLIIL